MLLLIKETKAGFAFLVNGTNHLKTHYRRNRVWKKKTGAH